MQDIRERSLALGESSPIETVYVVDDDVSVRESIAALLRFEGRHVDEYASADEFLACARPRPPCCLLLDLQMPGTDGLDLQARIAADAAELPIVFITAHADVPRTVVAMKAGAVEFLTKPLHDEVLVAAVASALERSREAAARRLEVETIRRRHASLTPRERDVMRLVVQGRLNKQVGADLGISEITVKAHRGRVMEKMAARSLPALVRMASRLGFEGGEPPPRH